jgi:general secretion pathway protein G
VIRSEPLVPSAAAARRRRGLTLIELLVTIAVMGILAGVAMPLAQTTATRMRELELRRNLRKIRESIDVFKLEYTKARVNAADAQDVFKKKISMDRSGYPLTLEEMVETKILRRVPQDPLTADGKWVLRSFSDNPQASLSDGKDVYDIRSGSKAVALDGTKYETW